jgi:mono/diheme cytochrome c family protein
MPSFAFLPEGERRKIAAHVLDKADLLESPEPKPIDDPGDGPPTTPTTIARGKEVYEAIQCWQCHGHGGKGDGPSAAALKDSAERPIKVRDFTTGVYRGGGSRKDLYYRFTTGMDGTPMPAFRDSVETADRWALADYVQSLKSIPPERPRPSDPLLAGREVAAKYSCRGCHVLDDGKGGDVGPDLRVSGQKLGTDWVATFLKAPRDYGKIYPWRVYRMPHLGLSDDEAATMARYLAAMGKRAPGPVATPDPAAFPQAKLDEGKNLFVLRCTECHSLGRVIETPVAKQQGPDLIRVAHRVDYDWAQRWIADPKKIDAKTKMTVPGISKTQIEAVRMFVWKASLENAGAQTAAR